MIVIDTDKLRTKESINNQNKYSKREVINILYDNLVPVMDKDYDTILFQSKYVRIAKDRGYRNYRLCTYADFIRLELENSFSEYERKFLANNGAVIAIFNTLNNKPISCVFRSVSEKAFMDYSLVYSLYGYDMMDSNFKYGDWIVITEGLYDADTLRVLYPNVLSTQTSGLNSLQANILKSMSDKFIFAFDSDEAGERGFTKAVSRLGVDIKKLPIFGKDKDVGVMEEKKNSLLEYNERVDFYKSALKDCMSSELGFSL